MLEKLFSETSRGNPSHTKQHGLGEEPKRPSSRGDSRGTQERLRPQTLVGHNMHKNRLLINAPRWLWP